VREQRQAHRQTHRAGVARITIEIPKDFQFGRDDRIGAKNLAVGEILFQAFKDNDVGRDQQKGFGVIVARFGNGVEELPRDRERHHFGLAAPRCHLDAIAREIVVLQEP